MDAELASWIARATGASRVVGWERIQALWSGYGELARAHLEGAPSPTVVVKWAKPPKAARGVSHLRKCRSYDVETAFYRSYSPRCADDCRVPRLVAERVADGEWVMVLEDLDAAGFSVRRRDPRGAGLSSCLAWLASFHATFVGETPVGLWETGTYWHLATRLEELERIADRRLRDEAPRLDRLLSEARFKTLVHGDAKPANYCFAREGEGVAAVDFQYVGGGPGIRDVAYLLHRSTSRAEEEASLAFYFERLRTRLPAHVDGQALEAEWAGLYGVACADFERFLAGWRG